LKANAERRTPNAELRMGMRTRLGFPDVTNCVVSH
jgi:hypothetical protein